MTPQEWIAHDPDPRTAAELAACDPDELAARFARPLTFGTAGLRGPVRGGPDAMNVAVVLRATWAVAQVLIQGPQQGLAQGGTHSAVVVVGRDARHGSAEFATAAAEVLAAQGFSVLLLPDPAPTPVVAFAVRQTGAAAGIQITASHNPAADNGFKVYFEGGIQIVSPTDRQIEAAMAAAPPADEIPRMRAETADATLVDRYIERAAGGRRAAGSVRVALTPLHGVGGAVAVETLLRAGFPDVHTVTTQFAPDPDFPTVAFPNPEEPGATDALLALAAEVGADVAIALDPDADRCAVGIPTASGWRMLSGDETGWLLGDYILAHAEDPRISIVASSLVSSRMLATIAARYGAVHIETLTGFKWLARADADVHGGTLVYAYEEAIGHCVDPAAVRDKDGISAAVLVCDLVAALGQLGRSVPDALDELARVYGVHEVAALSRPFNNPADDDADAGLMGRLRTTPPGEMAGFAATFTDIADALIFSGGDADTWARVVVRPSGTEPKVKCYVEVGCAIADDLAATRERARTVLERLVSEVRDW